MHAKPGWWGTVSLLVAILLGACSLLREPPAERALDLEPLLSAAGFHVVPADTPEKRAQLQSLTPAKVLYHVTGGQPRYWFADPYNCQCLYVGDEKAYQEYQKLRLQKQLADEQREAAMVNEAAAADMMMGPWW
ncbi:MAG: hypothetical protein E6J71_09740 [Deltaproteobacteria bacterium]|nr:MAG: hypothetical protein E6J81_18080 [Deltaproteobacteria bacterium]TMA78729.1 MAG: hypothetical protein E6J77_20815 [Deltaproteobacteria bacterium]TMB20315.1 MAG: hypothetical protein E6J71_09740 [Deltaproteobacteria bacterium]